MLGQERGMKEGRNREEKMTSRVVRRRRRVELGGWHRRPWPEATARRSGRMPGRRAWPRAGWPGQLLRTPQWQRPWQPSARGSRGGASAKLVDLPLGAPAHTEVRAEARSSEREGRSPGERYCSVEDDDDDHDARRWLRRVGACGSERQGGEGAKRG